MMNLDDIWIRVQKGEISAFELLYHILYPGLCQYASQLMGNRLIAEEIVQDLFVKVWENRKTIYSQNGSIRKYLFRLVHNQCIDMLKKQKTRKESFVRLLPTETWNTISEKYGFDEYLVEQLDSEEMAVMLNRAIDQLPSQCREIFIKSRFEHQKNEEIAEQMGLSVNTVRTQLYRAIQKIKQVLYWIIFLMICNQ